MSHNMAGYPQAIVADPMLDAWRAQYASQAAAFQGAAFPGGMPPPPMTMPPPGGGLAPPGLPPPGLPPPGLPVPLPVGLQGGIQGLVVPVPGLSSPPAPLPGTVAPPMGGVPNTSGLGGSDKPQQAAIQSQLPPKKAAEKQRETKEERARKEAAFQKEAERLRCHLHKKPKDSCKFCQRHKEFVNKDREEKAAAKEDFLNKIRGRSSANSDAASSSVGPLEMFNTKTYGFPPMLQTHIVESTHYKTLLEFQTIEEITHEIAGYADSVEPYVQNSTIVPSALFCCVYRLLSMGLTGGQLRRLIESAESAYIRCAGFLFIRFGLAPESLWHWLGEYTLDEQEFYMAGKDAEAGMTTVGQYVEALLTQDRYFSTILPRLPTPVKRKLEEQLAQVPQERKRSKANQRLREVYQEPGVRVEALFADGVWRSGKVVELLPESSRPKVRVSIEGSGPEPEEHVVHLGRVILSDSRQNSRSYRGGGRRSRSRSPGGIDWSREKGKSASELLDEHRKRAQDRAVCSSGKEYARRPVSFQVALPMEQGNASKGLVQDETYISERRSRSDHGDRDRSRSPQRDRGHSVEYQKRMQQLFEKYGQAKPAADGRRSEIEGPDVMRLG